MSTAEVENETQETQAADYELVIAEGTDGEGADDAPLPCSDGVFEDGPAEVEQPAPVTPITAPPDNAAWEHALLTEIRELEDETRTAEIRLDAAKEEAKACKGVYDDCVLRLRARIRSRDEKFPLFDGVKEGQASVASDNAGLAGEGVSTVEIDPADESWREVQLEHLSIIKEATLSKLYGASIETVGDLTDYQSANKQLTDIKGIGPAKVDQVSDAMEEFWKKWNAGERFNVASESEDEPDEIDL